MADAAEDEGEVELTSIQAIFPELIIDDTNSRRAYLDLEVTPQEPITVTFENHADHAHADFAAAHQNGMPATSTRVITYFPHLSLQVSLPTGYPETDPPSFTLKTEPQWLPQSTLHELQEQGSSTWEECGRMACVFSYIDFLQTEIERVLSPEAGFKVDAALEKPLVAFDKKAKKHKFDQKTYDCGICLSPKRGAACYQMQRCGHIFCRTCLQDFYNNAITEGDVGAVKCLDPDCGKDGRNERKQHSIHPTELLDMSIERSMVQRYVEMKLKKKLESDKTTIYCPRSWCQGPAKTEKYARYITSSLEDWPDSDDEGDSAQQDGNSGVGNRLAVCSKCKYAFCRVCSKGWHGDFVNCMPKIADETLSEEDRASYDFIRKNTSPCPYCNSPTQKTMGCNHMRCFQCNTHFCYLCSAWLFPSDPYKHFNTIGAPCYQRLWELEGGDEGQGRAEIFGGARAAEQEALILAARDVAVPAEVEEQEQPAEEAWGAWPDAHVEAAAARPRRPAPRPPGDPINREALHRFVAMAENDEEDGWDSDDLANEFDERVMMEGHNRRRQR